MFSQLSRRVAQQSGRNLFGASVFGGLAAAGAITASTVHASDDTLHPNHMHWSHSGYFSAYDTAALRRGYEVYRQVCSTCHSMKFLYFRNLVGNIHTEEQAKALAASYEVVDGPNDEGEMFERPGRLSDMFPGPYKNEETARFANGGALPPDLSCIEKARHSGTDYIFSLLTGYAPAPAGLTLRDGLHYNLYFPGGAISMAPPLNDGQVEYEDGTEATTAQMAKDVATFLTWCSEPEQDARKKQGMKMVMAVAVMAACSGYYKRFKWSLVKTRRISWID